MKMFINIYTYCISSILLFGLGLLAVVSLFPADATILKTNSFNPDIYTAISIDYSTLELGHNLG